MLVVSVTIGPTGDVLVERDEGLFYLADMHGRNLFSSPGLYAFIGLSEGSATGDGWHRAIHPDDLDYVRGFFADAQRSRHSFAGWWRIRRLDGTWPWALVGGMPFLSEISGEPIGYLGSIHPLERADAFPCAGGIIGPEKDRALDLDDSALPKVERIADLTLIASAMARESGEADIARALDEALMKIGFRLVELMRRPPERRAAVARPRPKARRRIAGRG